MFSWYNHGFGEPKVTKERFYAAKKSVKLWNVNGDNIVISKLIKTKTNSKYLIGYLDKTVRQLVLIMANNTYPHMCYIWS